MKSGMFLVGVLAGILLGAGVVAASGLASGMATVGSPANYASNSLATVTETASTTTTASISSVSPPLAALSTQNATASSTTAAAAAGGQLAFMSTLQSSLAQQPPSRVSRIFAAPFPSLLLLLPIVLAALLGFALRRASSPGTESQ